VSRKIDPGRINPVFSVGNPRAIRFFSKTSNSLKITRDIGKLEFGLVSLLTDKNCCFSSNVRSGTSPEVRKPVNQDEWIPCILEPAGSTKEYRKNWARLTRLGGLIQKIYEVDTLACPKCQGAMKVLSFIQDSEIIKKILKPFDLWDLRKPLSKANAPSEDIAPHLSSSDCQLPPFYDYLHVDEQYPEDFSV
jgi:hypothetical protein